MLSPGLIALVAPRSWDWLICNEEARALQAGKHQMLIISCHAAYRQFWPKCTADLSGRSCTVLVLEERETWLVAGPPLPARLHTGNS